MKERNTAIDKSFVIDKTAAKQSNPIQFNLLSVMEVDAAISAAMVSRQDKTTMPSFTVEISAKAVRLDWHDLISKFLIFRPL